MALPLLSGPLLAVMCLGLALLLTLLTLALIDVLKNAPVIGGWIADKAQALEQSVSHALGQAFSGIDHLIGASLHLLARYADSVWGEIKSHARLLALVASGLWLVVEAVRALRALVHHTTHANTAQGARIKRLEREYNGIEHGIKQLERELHGIDETGLERQVRTLDKEVAKIRTQTIPAIREADAEAESAISDLWTWVHKHVAIPGTDVFEGAVAVALAGLGLGGLRCPAFGRLLGKWGCGLGTLLNDLLGIAIAGLVLEGVCEFLPLIEDAFGAVAGPLVTLLNDVPLGRCETAPDSWARLRVAAGPLPPAQTLGTFGG